jgi:hypothetical protein
MSTDHRLTSAACTEALPAWPCPDCDIGKHRWTEPITEAIEDVPVTRWRCTCRMCQCDGLHVIVSPPTTGVAQHRPIGVRAHIG